MSRRFSSRSTARLRAEIAEQWQPTYTIDITFGPEIDDTVRTRNVRRAMGVHLLALDQNK